MSSREWLSLDEAVRDTIMSHQAEAPVRLTDIARDFGLSIRAATLPAGISGEIRPDPDRAGAFIVRVNRHDSKKRQRFTVAHEIAHFLLHRDHIGAGIMDDALYRSNVSNFLESQANRLAADILLPKPLLNEWIGLVKVLEVDDPVAYLADRFEVSEASMKIRLGLV